MRERERERERGREGLESRDSLFLEVGLHTKHKERTKTH